MKSITHLMFSTQWPAAQFPKSGSNNSRDWYLVGGFNPSEKY
jgi:hypothetical protein